LAFGANNCRKGAGGGTVHWASFTPRLHASDFRIHSTGGVGVDCPISYSDPKPYYELMELDSPSYYPWDDPHDYSIETPRLLVNSICPGFESGLANSSSCVDRYTGEQNFFSG
jgi:hypothetical protein